jgi:hypothetical protein
LVKRQTGETADFFGFSDRGRLAAGLRADLNLIDFDRLRLYQPELVHDMPAGGRRFVQRVDGYEAKFVAGIPIFEPQTRLTVSAGVVTGRPARTAACRAGFILLPACTTFPMTTVSISSGRSFARPTAAAIAAEPRAVAGTSLSEPAKVPIAVRTGSAKTICDVMATSLEQLPGSALVSPTERIYAFRQVVESAKPCDLLGSADRRLTWVHMHPK